MQETWEIVNEIPTCVKTWGRGIHEKPSDSAVEDIIFVIPGNPGVTEYYCQFAEKLYNNVGKNVWVISHAGHEFNPNKKYPRLSTHKHLYGLKAQIQHKVEFIEKFVSENVRLHLIGHSIGAYMALEVMKSPSINKRIMKSYLLFPTIEYMAETKNGQFLLFILKYFSTLLVILAGVFEIFPTILQEFLLKCTFFFNNMSQIKENFKGSLTLVHSKVLNKIFFLAGEEMNMIRERDNTVIENNLHKIKMIYGVNDDWAPRSYCNKIKNDICNIDATAMDYGHAFCVSTKYTEAMSQLVSAWILENH